MATKLPGWQPQEKRQSHAGGAGPNVAKQNVSHILALQQDAPLPLADSSIYAAPSQLDIDIANVTKMIDMSGVGNTQHLPMIDVTGAGNAGRPAIAKCRCAYHI